ncbi:TPA: hypothetical protein DDZ06_01810 [Candidatus Uhrbacteria bacterium]|uniref:Uncharacterized protein n=2 Tax=Candidatus Uhriibacteriota TaxID=1752732 RepID=A0A0G1Q880_9BACT|nr:MAG: hypothetical protein UX45_C0004G0039 [Candidatus Uhrbacteria bacterium GW2011_GWF2_46_218]KKU41047.1 MAG: hypothetical protein UX57_C0007G0079 [Candidatus Uhrbacteria bacterium GW2011_GWE2_46_68]HBK33733.1 hypothetical protein [Candidatus Uhrbacteria bacterium]
MTLFSRPTSESAHLATPMETNPSSDRHLRTGGDPASSALLGEAIMDSVSSVCDSLPKEHRAHFETLRQEIIDFTEAHKIPRESLGKPDLLREATHKLSIQDLERLALLLERFEYLLKNGEPKEEKLPEYLQEIERLYRLREQYDFQVSLLEQVGILKDKAILGINGCKYPIPTLEQIAQKLYEQRETLETKRDQGFTKLLLVPFGMSLDGLAEILEQFLLSYKKSHPSFNLSLSQPLYRWRTYSATADAGNLPRLVYYPRSFTEYGHQGKIKRQILLEREEAWKQNLDDNSWKGWTVHLLQPSDPSNLDSKGFAPIPRKGHGTPQGDLVPRPPLEAGKTPNEYLSILQKAQEDEDSPYHGETGMTPEDWIMAFMIHLAETEKPLDDYENGAEGSSLLTGAFFRFTVDVPVACWFQSNSQACLHIHIPDQRIWYTGVRSSVII